MEYNLHRDFNESFSNAFKKNLGKDGLLAAIARYVSGQGMQLGTQNFAEILVNLVYDGVPSIASSVLPNIAHYVKHNGNQAGMQKLADVLVAIINEGVSDADDAEECKAFVAECVRQNGMQTGLPILATIGGVERHYTFGEFLSYLVNLIFA